jgi:hypothetical protein
MAAPVFKDPAKQLQEELQTAIQSPSFQNVPFSNIPKGASASPGPMEMTPEMITRQNAVIKRLEDDFDKTKEKAEKQRIVKIIRSHLKDFPGTKSARLSEFEKIVGGRRRRHTKRRRSNRKTKKNYSS